METPKHRDDLSALASSISRSRVLVAAVFIVAVSAYAFHFAFLYGPGLHAKHEVWGQFGDFIGGLVNPLIAYFAFYWLTVSVRIQKEELSETRAALIESGQTQSKQERQAARTARINALAAHLQALDNDAKELREHIEFAATQILDVKRERFFMLSGEHVGRAQAINHIAAHHRELQELFRARQAVIGRLDTEFREHTEA